MHMKLRLILISLSVAGAVAGADVTGDHLLYVEAQQWEASVRLTADLTDYRGSDLPLEQLVSELKLSTAMTVTGQRVGRYYEIQVRAPLDTVTSDRVIAFEADVAESLHGSTNMAARMFHPARAEFRVTGPPLAEMDTDPATGVHFRLLDHRAAAERLNAIMGTTTHCNVNLAKKITIF